MLERRAAALLAGDLDAAGAVYSAADRDLLRRTDERAVAAGLVEWAVEDGSVAADAVHGRLRVRVDGEGRAVAGVFHAGWDPSGGLRAAAGDPQPWDLGVVQARPVPGGVVLVVGEPAPEVVAQVEQDLGPARDRVDAVWGTDWPRGTAVVVVPTAQDVTRLSGTSGVDAVAVGLDADLADGTPAGVRVVLSGERFAALSPQGRTITLTHELVHVATRGTRRRGVVPRWLTEGYADHVARSQATVPASALAAALLARSGDPQPPRDADFAAGPDQEVAYAAAWTLVTSAARRTSTATVTAWVRSVWGGQELQEACRDVLGVSFEEVLATWRDDVANDLVGWGP